MASRTDSLDRFIPNRAAMDFDFAHFMLMGGKLGNNNSELTSSSKEVYRKKLAEIFNMNRTRILAFKNKPPPPAKLTSPVRPSKPQRSIPQSWEKKLNASGLLDDYNLNLLDWGSNNVVAIAIQSLVYLWDASNESTSELVIDDEDGHVTSLSWAPNGHHIAVGLNNSHVQLWDTLAEKQLRTLRGRHRSRVGALDWNDRILTTGGKDGLIINNDMRIRSQIVETYAGHHGEVCGLKWSASGQQLASGGDDNLLFVWDKLRLNSPTQWLHRMEHHTAAVKALSWCPYQSNLLASGGGIGDQCIKLWNTNTSACLNSVDTGSLVSSLLWNENECELLSSHGRYADNQLTVWKYPSMVKIGKLLGHTSRVLSMAKSPNGCTVACAAADESLSIWNVFGTPEVAKPAPKTNWEPFANIARIR